MDRMILQQKLLSICKNVYYNPPENLKMTYPAIRYELADVNTLDADNKLYAGFIKYQVTVITDDPDNTIWFRIMTDFRWCAYGRRYVTDNLYHDVLVLYY